MPSPSRLPSMAGCRWPPPRLSCTRDHARPAANGNSMIEWIGAIAFVVGVVFVSVVIFLLLHRTLDFRRLEQHNDVAGFIYAVIGVIYGVLIAFVVIVVWGHHSAAEQAI